MTQSRPVIGIVISPPEDGSLNYNLNPEYAESVWRAGGAPIAIPLTPEAEYADQVMEMVDGLLFTGSKHDLDPVRFGEKPHPKLGDINDIRDDLDALLIARGDAQKLPMLGICHGCQAINVARGGTIVQDIVSDFGQQIDHRTRSATGDYAHDVVFEPNSALNAESDKLMAQTNSAHHQSINRVGNGLTVIACTADGVIEAVEHHDMADHFVLGIQWHPERLSTTDALSFRAFEGLIAATKRQ